MLIKTATVDGQASVHTRKIYLLTLYYRDLCRCTSDKIIKGT